MKHPLPFKEQSFDGVNLEELIDQVENRPQLIREIGRIVKSRGVVVISTPNNLNLFSRLRFVFTGFLRGRSRPHVIKARKRDTSDDLQQLFFHAAPKERGRAYLQFYEDSYENGVVRTGLPPARRRRRLETFCAAIGPGKAAVLELGCGLGELTYSLRTAARTVIASDVSADARKIARIALESRAKRPPRRRLCSDECDRNRFS